MLELRKMNWEDAVEQWRYVTRGLTMTLELARKIVPEEEICLRVLKTNIPSFRAICRNGAYIAGEDDEHYLLRIPK